jgi:hypothetical protein
VGCLRRFVLLAIVVVAVAAAWLRRDDLRALAASWGLGSEPVVVAPSEEIAAGADAKLDRLAAGESSRAALSSVEAQSLLMYRYGELLPAFVDSAEVQFDDGRIRLRGRLPVDRLPRVSEMDEVLALMPDTTTFEITTQLILLDSGRAALAVDGLEAARIPLPKRLAPALLRRLGRADEPGLPADALAFRLPPGAGAAYVRGDSLILLARADGS